MNGTVGWGAGIASSYCGNGDPVAKWVARTGQVYSAPSVSTRPAYFTNSGKPYVQGDDVDDSLSCAALSPSMPSPYWLYLKGRMTGAANSDAFYDSTSGTRLDLYNPGGTYNLFTTRNWDSAVAQGNPDVIGLRVGSPMRFRVNGSESTPPNSGGDLTAMVLLNDVNLTRPLQGYIKSVIGFTSNPSNAVLQQLETYMAAL